MPKRTNLFQQVVTIIQQHMARDATVEPSGWLVNRLTGEKREVDVVIRQQVAGYEVIVSVEATAGGRKADAAWVESMVQKHRNLPTSKLVLVSQAGFYAPARKLAEAENAVALAPEDLAVDDPAYVVVNALPSLWPKVLTIKPETARVVVRRPSGDLLKVRDVPPDARVFWQDGREVGAMVDVFRALYGANFAKSAEQIDLAGITEDIDRFFQVTVGPPLIIKVDGNPQCLYLQWEESDPHELHEIQALDVRGTATVRVGEIPLHHRRLGEIAYSYGEGKVGAQSVLLVVSEDEGGGKVTIQFGADDEDVRSAQEPAE